MRGWPGLANGLAPGTPHCGSGQDSWELCFLPAPAPEELAWGTCQGDQHLEAHVIM